MRELPEATSRLKDETQGKANRTRWEEAIESARDRLKLIRLCQKTPEANRNERGTALSHMEGHVYLKSRGEKKAYKIGSSGRPPKKRAKELKRMATVVRYKTVVYKALEFAAHTHFDLVRMKVGENREPGQRKNARGEQFWLIPTEVANFREILVRLEKWVLMAEEARLELWIERLEAAIGESLEEERPANYSLFE